MDEMMRELFESLGCSGWGGVREPEPEEGEELLRDWIGESVVEEVV